MDSTADTIRDEIDQRRQAISDDVNHLEERMHELTDFQHQYRERPMAFLGLAFGGGVVLGMLLSGSSDDGQRRQRGVRPSYTTYGADASSRYRGNGGSRETDDQGGFVSSLMSGPPGSSTETGKQRASSTFDEVRGALMAYAATRAEEFLKEALPGFGREVDKVRSDSGQPGTRDYAFGQAPAQAQSSVSSGATMTSRGEV
jgi:hypothetical protein